MGTINYAELQQDILNTLVKQVTPVNFKNLAYPEAKLLQKQLAGQRYGAEHSEETVENESQ